MAKEKLLEKKVVLVTGGGGGIGWGICLELAKEGARVAIVDINKRKGEKVLEEILKISPGHAFYHQDIRRLEKLSKLVDKIESELGAVDILINNAGVNTSHNFLEMTVEAWRKVLETNLTGHFFLSQALARRMVTAERKGVILFISSVHQKTIQRRPHYTASKAAMVMLVKEMAVELAPHGIRVVGVAPGGVYIKKKAQKPEEANDEPTVLLGGKNAIPRDIGRAVVMLASEYWSRRITGEILIVSGGQYLSV